MLAKIYISITKRKLTQFALAIFGPGETEYWRGYFLGPLIGVLFFFLVLWGVIGPGILLLRHPVLVETIGISVLGGLLFSYLGVLIFGIPAQAILKHYNIESGWLYILIGAITPPIFAFLFLLMFESLEFSIAMLLSGFFFAFSPIGIFIALSWWLLAKKRDRADGSGKI